MATADPRPVVLLTGFGPFPGIRRNASTDLVKKLAPRARRAHPQIRFVAAVLPTEWARGPRRVDELYAKHKPIAALHFGVAAGLHGFRIETEAANVCRPAPDAVGVLPLAAKLANAGPPRLAATNAEEIREALRAKGLPAEFSHDAGGYLCNAIFFHGLAAAERLGPCPVAFIHIPSSLAKPPMTMDNAVVGALEIIEVLIVSARNHASLTSV